MRKSSKVSTILLLGTAGVGLSACSEPQQDASIYPSTAACEIERSKEECADAFERARESHLGSAPRYTTIDACETDFGPAACQDVVTTTSDGGSGSVFIPIMMGYMMGRTADGIGSAVGVTRRPSRPVYVDRHGYGYTGDRRFGRFSGACREGQFSNDCRNSGTAIIGTGGRYPYHASVPIAALQASPTPATVSDIRSSRSYGGFGRTGGRAGGGG